MIKCLAIAKAYLFLLDYLLPGDATSDDICGVEKLQTLNSGAVIICVLVFCCALVFPLSLQLCCGSLSCYLDFFQVCLQLLLQALLVRACGQPLLQFIQLLNNMRAIPWKLGSMVKSFALIITVRFFKLLQITRKVLKILQQLIIPNILETNIL